MIDAFRNIMYVETRTVSVGQTRMKRQGFVRTSPKSYSPAFHRRMV
jgi:hypothetical protein